MTQSKKTVVDAAENTEADFLSRWSRRKHEVQQAMDDSVTENTSVVTDVVESKSEHATKILTDADMPDIASLTDDSDYTDFLSPGVSDALRRLALRKLFRSEVFNVCDGLDDYDEDYTQFKKLGSIVTADMHHQIELKAKRAAEQLLQEKQRLSDDDSTNEREVANRDATDENETAALDQETDQAPPEQSQALNITEKDAEALALNVAPSVKAGTSSDSNSDMKKNMPRSDDSAASELLQDKKPIQITR